MYHQYPGSINIEQVRLWVNIFRKYNTIIAIPMRARIGASVNKSQSLCSKISSFWVWRQRMWMIYLFVWRFWGHISRTRLIYSAERVEGFVSSDLAAGSGALYTYPTQMMGDHLHTASKYQTIRTIAQLSIRRKYFHL